MNSLFSKYCVECRTFRRFKQIPVPETLLQNLIEDVRIAPSARNCQVLRYVVVNDKDTVARIQPFFHFAAALPPEIGQPGEGEQPTAFIIICTDGMNPRTAGIDIGIAARTLQLGAWKKQVGSCILGNVEFPKVLAAIGNVPTDWKPALALALGYPDHTSTIVNMPADGSTAYTVDEQRNYYVPKRKKEDILFWK